MTSPKKKVLIALSIVLGLFVAELVREKLVYMYTAWYLQHTYWQVKPGMTKEQIRRLVGEPEGVGSNEPDEVWNWSAGNHQGPVWTLLHLSTVKGHYELVVIFDSQNRVSDIYGGVN